MENKDLILEADPDNFASVSLNLALLGTVAELADSEAVTITVNLTNAVDPAVGIPIDASNPESDLSLPDSPGYVISFPDPNLLSASVLPVIRISVLNGDQIVGEVKEYQWGVLDLIGLGIAALTDINNARVYLNTIAAGPYDKIRISFGRSLLDLLINIDVHNVGFNGVAGTISGNVENPLPSAP